MSVTPGSSLVLAPNEAMCDAGVTEHISNNNAAFVREAFLAAPLPLDLGPFASSVQASRLSRHGRLWFEPAASVTHAFAGIAMERDVRRHLGWAAIALRRRDPSGQLGTLVRGRPRCA